MYKVDVTIKGISPLLQHRFLMEETEETKLVTGEKDYSQDAEKAVYRDSKGNIFQPGTHIEGALIKAGTDFKIKGRGTKTFKELMKSSVFVDPEEIPLIWEGKRIKDFEIDARPVVVQRNRIVRRRPRFDKWEMSFKLNVMSDQIPHDLLKEILEHAGMFKGIGDWRPKFGRFEVTKFEKSES